MSDGKLTIRNINPTGGIVVPGWCTGEAGCVLHPGEECQILEERRNDICGHGISVVDPRTGQPVDEVEAKYEKRIAAKAAKARTIPPAAK